ncbi:trimeric LpxA-like protein [Pavlovales sp. CCMP2436]|nr:trimeric LpxA-like protein [Pavlovales sp. CCMP2436]
MGSKAAGGSMATTVRITTNRALVAKLEELSRPPGPASFWYGLGAMFRTVGKGIDEAGRLVQMESAYNEKLPIPCTLVTIGGKAPSIGQNFVAPSASLVGDVSLSPGASVWYGAVVRATGAPITIGELSCVQENATLVSKPSAPLSIGRLVTIGAGALVEGATLLDGCSVGPGCIIAAGSSMGVTSILAAGSVLAAKTAVPAGEIWAGKPAIKVGDVLAADAESSAADARATCALSVIHCEHAWMSLSDTEFTALQYKTELNRPENYSEELRDAPTFVVLPTLKMRITEVSAELS